METRFFILFTALCKITGRKLTGAVATVLGWLSHPCYFGSPSSAPVFSAPRKVSNQTPLLAVWYHYLFIIYTARFVNIVSCSVLFCFVYVCLQ